MNRRAEIFSRHFQKGEKLPENDGKKIRLFNMAFCPYGHRALLMAEAKKIPHNFESYCLNHSFYRLGIVNVDLINAPEWMFLEDDPKERTKVPLTTFQGKTIKESLDICEWFDEQNNERSLLPKSPEMQLEERKWAEKFQNVVKVIFPLFFTVFDNKEALPLLTELTAKLSIFDEELEKRETAFFSGNEYPGFLDYAIWPFIERLGVMKLLFPEAIDFKAAKEKVPHLETWRFRMEEDESVKLSYLDSATHHKYIENRRQLSRGFVSNIDYEIVKIAA